MFCINLGFQLYKSVFKAQNASLKSYFWVFFQQPKFWLFLNLYGRVDGWKITDIKIVEVKL